MAVKEAAKLWDVGMESHTHAEEAGTPNVQLGFTQVKGIEGGNFCNPSLVLKGNLFQVARIRKLNGPFTQRRARSAGYKFLDEKVDVSDESRDSRWIAQSLVRGTAVPKLNQRVIEILKRCLPYGAVIPYAYNDSAEGEYSLTWIVNGSRIEISIPSMGRIYVNCDLIGDLDSIEGFFAEPPYAAIRQRINALTRIVREADKPRQQK